MDGESHPEIVAMYGAYARVEIIDATNGTLQWQHWDPSGNSTEFLDMRVLDANGDGTPDFVLQSGGSRNPRGKLVLVDGATRAEVWSVEDLYPTDPLHFGDLDGDGADEVVVVGEDPNEGMFAFDVETGSPLWRRAIHRVSEIRVADVDVDGRAEVLAWGARDPSERILRVHDGARGEVVLTAAIPGEITGVSVVDVRGDGRSRILVESSAPRPFTRVQILESLVETIAYFDDASEPFRERGDGWIEKRNSQAYAGAARFVAPGADSNSAGWRLDRIGDPLIPPGTYDVFQRGVPHSRLDKMARDAPFKIRDRNGTTLVHIDQSLPAPTWQHLGVFEFDNGSREGVKLSDAADGFVVADAIRLIRRYE